jgi:homoserine kinase
MIKITIPATSANLGPGFDTLGLSLDLRNEITIIPSKYQSISIKGESASSLKLKDNNMFISIFNDFYENLTNKRQNFRFEFINNIPLSRGLGSSSAVIVSAIASAYKVCNIKIDKAKLLNLAFSYENHPDNIAPAVYGGFTVSIVKDFEVITLKKEIPSYLKAIMVIPNRAISTQSSRKTLPYKYSKEDTIFNLSHSSMLVAAFFSQNWQVLKEASKDKMHQLYRMRQMPELFEVQKTALNHGAIMSTLSGSGSSFFNMVHKDDESYLLSKLKAKFTHFKIISLNFDNNGIIFN